MLNISCHDICSTMSSAKAKTLPAFYALTRSDNTSFFSGTGPKSAYEKRSTWSELINMLCHLVDNKPEIPSSGDIGVIESVVISLYSVFCTRTDVKQAHQQTFAQSSRTFECLPPKKAALVEHIKIMIYQAGYVWGQSIIANLVLPSLSPWCWVKSETGWVPTVLDCPPSSRKFLE